MSRRWILLSPLAALAVGAAVALPIAAGGAQSAPPLELVVTQKDGTVHFDDVAPLTMKKGILSMGDRIVNVQPARINGTAAGTFYSDAVITNPTPRPFSKFTAMLDVTLRLKDGNLFAVGFVDAAHGGDKLTVIGGTGTYEGMTGTVTKRGDATVVRLTR